jgi:hypothetical protein
MGDAMFITDSADITVGSAAAGARNVTSGNDIGGVTIHWRGATGSKA